MVQEAALMLADDVALRAKLKMPRVWARQNRADSRCVSLITFVTRDIVVRHA